MPLDIGYKTCFRKVPSNKDGGTAQWLEGLGQHVKTLGSNPSHADGHWVNALVLPLQQALGLGGLLNRIATIEKPIHSN